jgi:serine-type D-Ala-D-Ala carboxypeptidase (penicillin-binding protein 5/6)
MTLSILQKLMLFTVNAFIALIWFVDVMTSSFTLRLTKRFLKILSAVFAVLFVSFVIYSYVTKNTEKIFEGYFSGLIQYTPVQKLQIKEYPVLIGNSSPPAVTAKSYLVADKRNFRILYSRNADQKQPPASTAKLMTALVALDLYDLNEKVEVPEVCTKIDSTKAWLPVKSSFQIKDLIYSMLIGSAGDSACVLAMGKLPYENFVSLMNRKAALIGLSETHFSNPIGLDDTDGQNYSTVTDLYILAKTVMQNPVISDAVKMPVYYLKSSDSLFATTVYSTNQLLQEIPNTLGIKTGTTESAGEVFVYDYADADKDLIIIVMDSKDRFSDTKALLYWALRSYRWK